MSISDTTKRSNVLSACTLQRITDRRKLLTLNSIKCNGTVSGGWNVACRPCDQTTLMMKSDWWCWSLKSPWNDNCPTTARATLQTGTSHYMVGHFMQKCDKVKWMWNGRGIWLLIVYVNFDTFSWNWRPSTTSYKVVRLSPLWRLQICGAKQK